MPGYVSSIAIVAVAQQVERTRGTFGHGGTDFRPPFDYLAGHPEIEPSCLIYITDGCGTAPEHPPSYPVLWLLTADGEPPAPWGTELRLRHPRTPVYI